MYRKCLIMIGTLLLSMGTLYAHPNWGVTAMDSQYEWAKKTATVVVELLVEQWADIKLAPDETGILGMIQVSQDPVTYRGSVSLEAMNNFPDFRIVAQLSPSDQMLPDDPSPGDNDWSVALTSADPDIKELDMPSKLQDAVMIEDINMDPDNRAPVELWVEVGSPWFATQVEDVLATVTLTMFVGNTPNRPRGAIPPVIDVTVGME